MSFKIPNLNADGTLSQESGMEIYNHYLNVDRIDFDGERRKPTKVSIVHAMMKSHIKSSLNLIEAFLAQKKRIFFWSDQHFNHSNIIKYSNRPFEDKEHMNSVMIKNYFNTVNDDDLVIWGGDVAFGSVEETRQILKSLPGKKILILGNHDFDKNKLTFRNYHIFDNHFMSYCFSLKIENKICNILLTHYPVDNKWLPDNTLNVHGHIHVHTADKKNINISVEHTNYKPILLDEIIKEKFLENYL